MSVLSKFPKIGTTFAAGLVTAALAGPALAEDDVPYAPPPDDPAAAMQAKADAAQRRADQFEAAGGWAYKTGAVDRANQEAARLQAEADAIRAHESGAPVVVATTPPATPELDAAQAHLKILRDTGGPAYKSGAVDQAEAEVRKLSGTEVVAPVETAKPPANWEKPIEHVEDVTE